MRILLAVVFSVYFSLITASSAQNTAILPEHIWTLTKVTGQAWVKFGDQEQKQVKADQKFSPGETLITGPRTRVQLTRNKEHILVGSNTTISLPMPGELQPEKTIIRQTRGTLHLNVSKKNVKHFSVETPFMVAAVKGTKFAVSIGEISADVRVQEGVVEVRNTQSDQMFDVRAGQTVTMNLADYKKANSSSGKIKPVRMVFIDRGDDHPDIIAQRAREKARAQDLDTWGVAGNFIDMLSGATSWTVSYVNHIFDSTVDAVLDLIQSYFDTAMNVDSLRKWVGLILSAVAVGLVIGVGAAYFAVRRKGA